MGMDAKVSIWVGIRSEDCDIDEFIERVPKAWLGENSDGFILGNEIDKAKQQFGCVPNIIHCSDELAGFGVEIFTHDWDYGSVLFDIANISERIKEATVNLKKLFSEANIQEGIDVWCQTDWR